MKAWSQILRASALGDHTVVLRGREVARPERAQQLCTAPFSHPLPYAQVAVVELYPLQYTGKH